MRLRNKFKSQQVARDIRKVFAPIPVVVHRNSPNVGNTTWKCAACRKGKCSGCFSQMCNCVCPDLVAEGL